MQLLLRLAVAPFIGLLITLATIPMMAIAGGGIVAFLTIGGAPGIGIVAIAVVFILILMNAIVTQMARYAGSFSGALRLSEQIPFRKAFWRVLIILILFSVAWFVLALGLIFAFAQNGPDVLAFMGSIGVQGDDDASEEALIAFLESKWFLSYTLLTMLTSAVQALILVPAACGMGERFALAWTGTYFMQRLVLVIPFLSIMVHALGAVFGAVLVDLWPSDADIGLSDDQIRWTLISVLGMQFGMAGEAAVLRSARAPDPRRARQVETEMAPDVSEQRGSSAGDLLRERMSR